jgi:transposase
MKVLGVGLISAFALLAVVGDERRFERPESLVAYIELNPASAKAARARTSNSPWAKEAVGIPHLPACANTSKFSSLHDYMPVLCGLK